jgi:hypothetical protein
MQVSQGFTLIGEDREQTPMDLSAAEPAEVVVFDQTLFLEGDVPWEKGDEVGVMHGVAVVTHGGKAICNLIFRFDDEDSITAGGVLPAETVSVGAGVITVGGGTGKYRGLSGQVRIETRNPKRYGFQV